MTDREESPVFPDSQGQSNLTFGDDPNKQAYLTLDYNTFNFPLDMEYVYDVTFISLDPSYTPPGSIEQDI